MAYLNDPGSVLSNAIFGKGAFGQENAMPGFRQDAASGQWYQWGDDPNFMGDSSNPGAWSPVDENNMFYYSGDAGTPTRADPSRATPNYFLTGQGLENFSDKEGVMNSSNIKVVDKIDGGYLVMSKTGDKKGTVYAVIERPDGQYQTAGVVKDNVNWDTNNPWWKQNIGILSVLAAPVMAYAGQVVQGAIQAYNASGGAMTLSQALNQGFANASSVMAGGMAFPTGVADPFTLAGANTGAGAAAGVGAAGPSNVFEWAPPGVDPFSNLPPTGPHNVFEWSPPGTDPFSNTPPTGAPPGGLEDVVRMPEVEITGTPPGPPTDLPPPVPPTPPTPDWDKIAPIPTIPGQNPGLPNLPGGGGGGDNNSNPLGLINLLQWMLDARNKYELGKDQLAFFDDKWKKIFGQSDQFENMLMGTYKDPASYYQGVEGQALGDMMENRLMRQDFKSGLGTNSTNRERLFQQGMLSNLGNHRTGLLNSAALGRNASSAALDAAGKAFQGFADSRNFMSPIAFGAGNSGAGLQDIWNIGKDIWNTGTNLWNWATGG